MICLAYYLLVAFIVYDPWFIADAGEWDIENRFAFGSILCIAVAWDYCIVDSFMKRMKSA